MGHKNDVFESESNNQRFNRPYCSNLLRLVAGVALLAGTSHVASARDKTSPELPNYEVKGAFPVAPDSVAADKEAKKRQEARAEDSVWDDEATGDDAVGRGGEGIAGVGAGSDGTASNDEADMAGTGASAGRDAAGSECGLEVIAKSPNAVGNPCMTTQEFMAQLGLTPNQQERIQELSH